MQGPGAGDSALGEGYKQQEVSPALRFHSHTVTLVSFLSSPGPADTAAYLCQRQPPASPGCSARVSTEVGGTSRAPRPCCTQRAQAASRTVTCLWAEGPRAVRLTSQPGPRGAATEATRAGSQAAAAPCPAACGLNSRTSRLTTAKPHLDLSNISPFKDGHKNI